MIDSMKGITEPPLDELLEHVDNKYQLVIFASRRARQINDYYADLHDGAIYENVGPLVDSAVDDKPLSIALQEINQNKLEMKPITAVQDAGDDLDFGINFDEFDDAAGAEETAE